VRARRPTRARATRAAAPRAARSRPGPISTPRLKPASDQPSASRGSPNSASTLAKPKP
jgi:hypothetical protein